MLTFDDRQIKRYEADLKTFAKRAFPFATKNTVNQAAFTAQRIGREGIKHDFILRNPHTVRSIQVEQTRTLNVRNQAATVGSIAPYMEQQEFGGTKVKRGKEGVPIPTSYSAGQGENAQPRTRLPRRPNTLPNIRLSNRRTGRGSKKQRNFIAVKQAAQSGQKFVFMDLTRRRGIFRVLGGKRNPRVKMIWDLSSKTTQIPRRPWLAPAVRKTIPMIPQIYKNSLVYQLKRHNIFR
jgi:hypothetical protein